MQRLIAGLLAVHGVLAVAAPAPLRPGDAADVLARLPVPAPAVSDAPVLTDDIIRKAVHDTLAEMAPSSSSAHATGRQAATFGASADTGYGKLAEAFNQAKVPSCLHGDALKLQPAHIGPVAVVGPYSLPWVVAAAIRGKCR